jgi:hypothetical protein
MFGWNTEGYPSVCVNNNLTHRRYYMRCDLLMDGGNMKIKSVLNKHWCDRDYGDAYGSWRGMCYRTLLRYLSLEYENLQ